VSRGWRVGWVKIERVLVLVWVAKAFSSPKRSCGWESRVGKSSADESESVVVTFCGRKVIGPRVGVMDAPGYEQINVTFSFTPLPPSRNTVTEAVLRKNVVSSPRPATLSELRARVC
jgi:hypothetical protein